MVSKWLAVLMTLVVLGCSGSDSTATKIPSEVHDEDVMSGDGQVITDQVGSFPKRIAAVHLPNPVQLHWKVISGGLPDGDEAFQELKSLSVKTIISVDGMTPDVETAAKYGMTYVHLPHGYDGIPELRTQELAKAVRDLEGPIYIHCHHGKHRSPVAASVACVSAGLLPQSQVLNVLEIAGTDPNYRGLFESAKHATRFEDALLDELQVEFHSQLPIPLMAEAMVAISQTYDRLTMIEAQGWKSPSQHPDLDPAHEALILREQFQELLRTNEVQELPHDFREMLKQSASAAEMLEAGLRTFHASGQPAISTQALSEFAGQVQQNCQACHHAYRDIPLSEKSGD